MTTYETATRPVHSAAWIASTQITFGVALFATGTGIFFLPLNMWARGYLAMGMLLCVVASINLSKTIRDQHEAERFVSKVEGAKVEQFLAQHDPMKV